MFLALGATGLMAGSLKHFQVAELITAALGEKAAHNHGSEYGKLAAAMILQLTDLPSPGLWGVAEYFVRRPLSLLLGEGITVDNLNRYALARCLDKIHEYGSVRLFLLISYHVLSMLDISVTEMHLDSTSFHYDGNTRNEVGCLVQAKRGYSRDHRADLNQFNQLLCTEGVYGLPILAKTISGNINDNISFADIASGELNSLKRLFQDLTYFVGDSALCTAKIFQGAKKHEVHVVTRPPDGLSLTKSCFEYADKHPEKFVSLPHSHREDGYSAMWYPYNLDLKANDDSGLVNSELFGVPVKLLIVRNESALGSKTETVNKAAQKERERIERKLTKLRTNPALCKGDARKNLAEIQATCKLTTVIEDGYDSIKGYEKRGRPAKNAQPKDKAVIVRAHVELNQTAINAKVQEELKFVIATTDVDRDWDMAELKAIYSRQSRVERDWRVSKDPRFFIDAIYLQRPSRITALLWLVSVGLLMLVATEVIINRDCRQLAAVLPEPDSSQHKLGTKLTYARVRNFFFHYQIGINCGTEQHNGKQHPAVFLDNMTQAHYDLVSAMGQEWQEMYDETYIRSKIKL